MVTVYSPFKMPILHIPGCTRTILKLKNSIDRSNSTANIDVYVVRAARSGFAAQY